MLQARSPKYPGLYDPVAGVRFRSGRAEVTDEQAYKLAERRYTDGILIEEQPAKEWARDQRRANPDQNEPIGQDAPPLPEPVTGLETKTRKAR